MLARCCHASVQARSAVAYRCYSTSPSSPPRIKRGSLFIPVAHEDPSDAQIPSHKLMVRSGMIRRSSSGIYSMLPTALRALGKITAIVDQEMHNIGGQKLQMPKLISAELWKQTDRWNEAGDELIRVKDRKGEQFCLGPTHEEVITKLVANDVTSYNQLPLRLYQIGEKYRDEIRPRFGLMRGREFTMKDMYSFDVNKEAAYKTYDEVMGAYHRIMKRLGLDYYAVEADSGKIGGSRSHEFQVVSDIGEDTVLRCMKCGYAANVEIAEGDITPNNSEVPESFVPTSILDLYQHFANGKHTTAVVFNVPSEKGKDTKGNPVVLFMDASRTPNEFKLKTPLAITQPPDLVDKSRCIEALDKAQNVAILIDSSVHSDLAKWIASASQKIGCGDPKIGHFRAAAVGDKCVQHNCSDGKLESTRGIEVGHVFYLGTIYSSKLAANVTYNNQNVPIEMGCYGIGISRILAAVVETNHDNKGIKWPVALAPYKVVVLSLASPKEPALQEEALKIYDEISGIPGMRGEVVLDDRSERPGFKMNDAALIGYPFMVVVGKITREQQKVEIEERRTGKKHVLTREEMVQFFKNELDKVEA